MNWKDRAFEALIVAGWLVVFALLGACFIWGDDTDLQKETPGTVAPGAP